MSDSTASSDLPTAIKTTITNTVEAALSAANSLLPSTSTSDDSSKSQDSTEEATLKSSSDSRRTVFDSATDFNVRHPLYAKWQLWFDSASKADKTKSWDEALVKVINFDSVEEFWGMQNNIVPPSNITLNSNYYLFKEGIKPAWEDKANSQGGKWSVQLPRGKYQDKVDTYWLYTLLAAIGETFETPYPSPDSDTPASTTPTPFTNEVTGIIFSSRKAFFRISIWTRSSSPEDKEKLENIGRHFKYGVLEFDSSVAIGQKDKVSSDVEFVSHADSTAKYGKPITKWTV